jgi:hypothetical protein
MTPEELAARQLRPIRIEGGLAYVPLTKGYEAVIDAADVPLVSGYNWCALEREHTVYAVRTVKNAIVKNAMVRMHRTILSAPTGVQVDHVDCNGLNNRRANLRLATPAQNSCNRRRSRANRSGYKGVSFHSGKNKWQSAIRINGIKKHLGYFASAEAAYQAYVAANPAAHGEFGRVQ